MEIGNIHKGLENGLNIETLRDMPIKAGIDKDHLLDLRVRTNPFGCLFDDGKRYASILGYVHRSCSPQGFARFESNLDFRAAASSFVGMGVGPENIMPVGTRQLRKVVAGCFLKEGDLVLMPMPSSPQSKAILFERKANVKHLDRQDMLSGRMGVDVPDACKIVFVSNPDYLSGVLLSAEAVGSLAGQCREKGALLFVDESLIELSDPGQSVASLVLSSDNILIIRSASSTFALPGPEVSFAIASPGLLGKLRMLLPAYPASPLSLSVASSMMRMKGGCNSSYLRESRKYIEKQRASLTDLFTRHGYKSERSDSTYILVKLKMVMGLQELTQRLASHGIMLLDCSPFYMHGEDYVRIAVTTRNNIERLEETFGIVLGEWARDHARTSLERVLIKGELTGSNTQCPYYPCHFPGQDCTFCYCPFNPCEDERTGGEWIDGPGGRKGWSCMGCCLIHESWVAQQVLDIVLEHDDLNEGLKVAWLNIISPYL